MTTPIKPDAVYRVDMTGMQALILQRAVQLIQEVDLATIGPLLTVPCVELVEEAAILDRMFNDLASDGCINGFAL